MRATIEGDTTYRSVIEYGRLAPEEKKRRTGNTIERLWLPLFSVLRKRIVAAGVTILLSLDLHAVSGASRRGARQTTHGWNERVRVREKER